MVENIASHPYIALGGILTVLLLWNYVSKRSRLRGLPLPPGPKGWPIIGSLLEMPQERTWLVYDKWFKIYGVLFHTCSCITDEGLNCVIPGDMVYFEVLGKGYLILGSTARTNDIFEKRSVNYSDRPQSTMLIDL